MSGACIDPPEPFTEIITHPDIPHPTTDSSTLLDALRPVALQLDASRRQLIDAIRDFPSDAWETRLADGVTNHAAFLALHLLDARCFILRSIGVEEHHGFEDRTKTARRLEDIAEYPGPDEILAEWERVAARTGPALEAITIEQLAGDAPFDFPVDDDTLLGTLAFLAQHEAYHVGQLGLIRRAHGLSALFGSPSE